MGPTESQLNPLRAAAVASVQAVRRGSASREQRTVESARAWINVNGVIKVVGGGSVLLALYRRHRVLSRWRDYRRDTRLRCGSCWRSVGVAGLGSRVAVCAWTLVGLGVIASALFWGWLIHLDIFI